MIHDRPAKYNMGFGIVPGEVPYQTDPEGNISGGDPQTGYIAKALHGHPIAKFLAVSAATAVAMHVGTKMMQGGGVKLAESLAEGAFSPVVSREWQTGLLHGFRNFQKTLDEFEGIGHVAAEDGKLAGTFKKGGFWVTEEEKKAMAERRATGGHVEGVAEWTMRNELQQRLIHTARSLPYQLPTLYAAGKVTNHITGNEGQRDPRNKVKWYHPVDVIGDFAQQSTRALATMILPGEIGAGVGGQSWRKLMTYGDDVSRTQPYRGEIRNFSVSLQASLARFGHSSSKILYEAQKKSSQVMGSYSEAISEGIASHPPRGFNFSNAINDIRSGYKEAGWRQASIRAVKSPVAHWIRTPDIAEGYREQGLPGVARRLFPTSTGFSRRFKEEYERIEDLNRNREAIHRGDAEYIYKGTSHPVNRKRMSSGGPASTSIEQFGSFIQLYGEPGEQEDRTTGQYSTLRKRDAYKELLREGFAGPRRPGVSGPNVEFNRSMEAFLNRVSLDELPTSRVEGRFDPRREAMQRLSFGSRRIIDEPIFDPSGKQLPGGTWESVFGKRLEAIKMDRKNRMNPEHAQYFADRMVGVIERADAKFLNKEYQANLDKEIRSGWKDIYGRILTPQAKAMMPAGRLDRQLFGENMSPAAKELMVRRVAGAVGLDTEKVSTSVLRRQLADSGIDPADVHSMRAILTDKNVITKPWQTGGFNILGMKPLGMNEALRHGFFPDDLEPHIQLLNQNMADRQGKGFAATSGLDDRPVGKGIYQTAGGGIVDLSALTNAATRTADMLARNLQIPIIKITPFDISGYKARRQMSQKPMIQMESIFGTHSPALGFRDEDTGKSLVDTMIYIRNKGSKGEVFGHRLGEEIRKAPGLYRSAPTGGNGILARNVRLGLAGGEGYYDDQDRKGWRKKFALPTRQPGSIFDFLKEMRHGEVAKHFGEEPRVTNNSAALAKRILAGDFGTGAEDTQAAVNFDRELRRQYGISGKIAKETDRLVKRGEAPESLAGVFSVLNPDQQLAAVPVHEISDAADMYRFMDATLGQHYKEGRESDPASTIRRDLPRAAGRVTSFMRQKGVPGALGVSSGQDMKATGIHTRMDEFRAEIYRYLVARKDILSGGSDQVIQDLLNAVDALKSKGRIGGTEYQEARAAILSMHLNILDNTHRKANYQFEGERVQAIMNSLLHHEGSKGVLQDIGNYQMKYLHQSRFPWEGNLRRGWASRFGFGEPEYQGFQFRPYGGNQRDVFVPTAGSALRQHPLRAMKSLTGINTWSDPGSFSTGSIIPSHLIQRLNRYFSMLGAGVDEGSFKGPLGFHNKGLVGRRVLPAVVGAATLGALDRTAGGLVSPRSSSGRRQYQPLVGGAVASSIAHAEVLLTPGKGRRQEKREELFGDRDVAIRKGRYWPLGNQPWAGTKVMYHRPSWYQRYTSGYKYTDQTYGSPLGHLALDHDYSPLRPLDPYRFEKQHYEDRPYPVTGEYFTGPWGPLTTGLNMTLGHVLKPARLMHRKEMKLALSQMQASGEFGMAPQRAPDTGQRVLTRLPTGAAAILSSNMASQVLGAPGSGAAGALPTGGDYQRPYNQPYGFLGMPYGTSPDQALESYKFRKEMAKSGSTGPPTVIMDGGRMAKAASGNAISNAMIANVNNMYEAMAGNPARHHPKGTPMTYTGDPKDSHYTGNNAYNRTLLTNPGGFDPRVMAAADPVNPGSLKYQFGQSMYEAQELGGIYGFAAGQVKEFLGYGPHDWHPRAPVLQSAGRAYGSERAFWDLNLGGLGDFPTPSQGEYGNIEGSEIARRFVTHRRREINEINPLENKLGKDYPWLPGSDYFINFHQGDPYALIPEGEMRLPGPGYEATHKLHSDVTGKYGILDQYKILADVAPWSSQYKAMDKVVKSMNLSEEDQREAITIRKQKAELNKRHTFYDYQHAHSDFRTVNTQVVGFMPGDADTLRTGEGIIKLAGVRARAGPNAEEWMHKRLKPGQDISYTYDFNDQPAKGEPVSAIVQAGRHNINKELLGEEDLSFASKKQGALENRVRENAVQFHANSMAERAAHLNTIVNTKFVPHRTALEDWERTNVYGSSFPQWQHPYRDFIRPLSYRAMNRNPIVAAIALGAVGGMFGREVPAKTAGRTIGAGVGFLLAFHSDAKSIKTGSRFIPLSRKKENAIEENIDILNYVKYSSLYSSARMAAVDQEKTDPEEFARKIEEGKFKERQYTNLGPNTTKALEYRKKMLGTMYGADPYGDVINLAAAIPKRKRDYFLEFLNAPKNDRAKILSTAPRLERRIYEARWGMQVESRPNLNDYFAEHELPSPNWSGWNPNVSLEDVKLKMVNHQGLDASQMGYFPQQIHQANLTNTTYPNFSQKQSHQQAAAQLQALMASQGIAGSVQAMPSNRPGRQVELQAGVYQ